MFQKIGFVKKKQMVLHYTSRICRLVPKSRRKKAANLSENQGRGERMIEIRRQGVLYRLPNWDEEVDEAFFK